MTFISLDTETTGLNPEVDAVWQISGIIYKDGISEPFDFKMKPYNDAVMNCSAFIKTGVSQEELNTYPDQKETFNAFNQLMQKYLYKEDGTHEKAFLVGYNVNFDVEFLCKWFEFNNHPHLFRSYFYHPWLDVMTLSMFYYMAERPNMPNFKLTTVYEKMFGKSFENAHSGDADSLATWELFTEISKTLMKNKLESVEI